MMLCEFSGRCGGCLYRDQRLEAYQNRKLADFEQALNRINQSEIRQGDPLFVADSTRRRANLAFTYRKKCLCLGFNRKASAELVDLSICPLLTPGLNAVLPAIRELLAEICAVPLKVKKGKKITSVPISEGSIWLTEAANGIDLVLEFDGNPELDHRMIINEKINAVPAVIRVSHRDPKHNETEPILEKAKPYINIGGYAVYIPAGTFLQPSAEGEQALGRLVLKYLGDTQGNIADLFCGVGTFSYILAANINNKMTAVDSSASLLSGFQESVNRNQIPNIKIIARNLFKYPLENQELANFAAVVFDPPRAGAKAQVEKIAALDPTDKPAKVIAVSCNPATFVRDANTLISGGYYLQEATLVDQFIYSDHSEIVALFTKE